MWCAKMHAESLIFPFSVTEICLLFTFRNCPIIRPLLVIQELTQLTSRFSVPLAISKVTVLTNLSPDTPHRTDLGVVIVDHDHIARLN